MVFHDVICVDKLMVHVNLLYMLIQLADIVIMYDIYFPQDYFAKWGEEGVVDLKDELNHILMLIASRCLLGNEFRESLHGNEVREKPFGEIYTLFSGIEEGVNLVSFMLPYFPVPANHRRDKARIRLTEIVYDIMRSRKTCGRVEEDVLQKLMDSRYKDGRRTTEAAVAGMIIGLIFAGKHTSSNVSTWTGACLLTHTKFLDAVVEEQREIIRKYKDKIDYNVLSKMETLHSCIKEAGRMHPVTLGLIRQTEKNINVRTKEGTEYGIPKGDTLVNLVMLTSKLSHIYKDPEVYDPYRFHPGREEDKVGGKFSYAIFGGGIHVCPGEAYAFLQIKIIWSHLVRNFELKLTSPFSKTDWSKFVLEPKGKVLVNYKRRRLESN
uniref:Obtusifoliol 14-alpha demethylase n=1 Tax=Aegilops tauschii subsp. strangulata TaxID=200361 RepID=A0A453AB54_AEGTS